MKKEAVYEYLKAVCKGLIESVLMWSPHSQTDRQTGLMWGHLILQAVTQILQTFTESHSALVFPALFLYLHYLHTRAACDYQHTRNSGLCLRSTGMVCFLLLLCLQRAIPSTAVSMTHMYWRCEEEVWTRGSKYLRKITAAWTNAVSDEWSFMTEWGSDGFIQVQWEHWNLSFNVSHTMLDQRPVKGACYRVNTLSLVILVMLALLDKNKVC